MADQFLGEIRFFAFDYPPMGWALCDGQLLQVNQNQALFSLLGTTFGGNGTTTFALPDLRGRVPVHPGASIHWGTAGGTEKVALAAPQIPGHKHQFVGNSGPATSASPSGGTWAVPATFTPYGAAATAQMSSAALAEAGGGQGHENRQPYLVGNFCIALQGIYPTRT